MNKPIREPCKEPCRTCANYRYCGLERRGICTDYKRKEVEANERNHIGTRSCEVSGDSTQSGSIQS